MAAYAYCRVPNLLFECAYALHPTPVNNDIECGHSGMQPVRYRDVSLKQATNDGTYRAGDQLRFVDVDWLTCHMYVYLDEDDADNRIISEETTFSIVCDELSSHEYAVEIGALIRRGHSLTDPRCTCVHSLSTKRALQLGVKPTRTGQCCCVRQTITSEMIGVEIAMRDWDTFVDRDGVRLHALTGELQLSRGDGTGNHIRNPSDLVDRLRDTWPFPLQMPCPSSSYAGIIRDSRRLHSAGKVAMLPSAEVDRWSLFFVDDMGLHVDADIRQLWGIVNSTKSS